MKNALITGASSFIGIRLCRKMVSEGWHVYAVVRESFNNKDIFNGIGELSFVYCDMENYSQIDNQICCEELECAVLLAWNGTRGAARDDRGLQQANVEDTMRIIPKLTDLSCKTIVLAGSQAEYGPNSTDKKVTEKFPCRPNTEYGKAKLRLYEYFKTYCVNTGIRLIEPRFFSLYGENDFEGTMIISTIKSMLLGIECNLTECKQLWDFMYVDDAVNALYKLIDNPEAGGVFNFGSGESRPLREYVQIMKILTKSTSNINYGAVPYPKTGIVHTNPAVDKLYEFTGYTIHTSFEDGIRKIMSTQRKGRL